MQKITKYGLIIGLTGLFFLTELISGIYTGSLALQTDAFHMLSDVAALSVGLGAVLLLKKKPHHRFTYGWERGEIIGGLVNSVFLLAICFILGIDAIEKFVHIGSGTVDPGLRENVDVVLIVGGCGLLINVIGIVLFSDFHDHSHGHGHSHDHTQSSHANSSLGERSSHHSHGHGLAQAAVLLHVIGDALGSIAVIISGALIKWVDSPYAYYADPIATLLIIVFISVGSVKILIATVKILMHHWSGLPTAEILPQLLAIPGVTGIHDFHIWTLSAVYPIATMHVRLSRRGETKRVIRDIKRVLHRLGIHCSTIQPEWTRGCSEQVCETNCRRLTCCQK